MISSALFLIASLAAAAQTPVPQMAPSTAPAKALLAPKEEPGDRLVVNGRILAADGKTPVAGASIYVYQTDKLGIYSRPVDDSRAPRLYAHLRSDADGRYEYETIKPGSYPNSRNPAHIHYVVNAPGFEKRVFEIVFEDDPFVDADIRARAAKEYSPFSIRTLSRDAKGVLRCVQDVKLAK